MKKAILLLLFPLLSIFAQAQSLLPDDAGSVSIKPVKSPYVLLDKIAKQIKRDSEQTRGICSLRVDATYNKDDQPQFSASGIYKGRVSVGIDLRRIETVEAPILNGWRCTGLFPQDMFYKCTHLQTVIPPEGTGIDGTVRDKNSQVRYVTDTDLH